MRKTAFVTGAGVGIGQGIAQELMEAGYDLALHCNSSRAGVDEVAAEAEKYGVKVVVLQADLRDHAQLEAMFTRIREEFDHLDLMVCNAGVTVGGPFLKTTPEQFDLLVGVDLHGTFFTAQLAAQYMVEKGTHGQIVIISSNQGHVVFPLGSAYGSIKAALAQFTQYLSIELAPYGIRANEIAPGWTYSPRMEGMQEMSYPTIPMRRWGTPREIGKAILFLDSEDSKSITGASLLIDGGAHAFNASTSILAPLLEKYL